MPRTKKDSKKKPGPKKVAKKDIQNPKVVKKASTKLSKSKKGGLKTPTKTGKPFRNAHEYVMIVDKDTNKVVGRCTRGVMRANNLWHRASYVFVENSNK